MRELAGSELGGDPHEAARRRRAEAKEREGVSASAAALGVARPSAAEAAAQTRDELWAARLRQLMGRGDDSVLRIMPAVADPTNDGPDAKQDTVLASQPLSARLRTRATAIPPCGPQSQRTTVRIIEIQWLQYQKSE
jgi:hypothetical protein